MRLDRPPRLVHRASAKKRLRQRDAKVRIDLRAEDGDRVVCRNPLVIERRRKDRPIVRERDPNIRIDKAPCVVSRLLLKMLTFGVVALS